jgi:CRISPR/Cas system-associated exonuclease Cas4 (RecB family)
MAKIPAWSFSSLKTFTTCPKKFYHTKVLKDVKEPEGEQALYGKLVHEVAELYIRDGKEIPEKFAFIKPALDSLLKIQGEKLCEFKMALTDKLEPCDFFSPDCWFRGVADLLIVDREKGEARVVDYKLGKSRYADLGQLELMALAVFKLFPEVTKVKGGLLFLAEDKFVPSVFEVEQQHRYWGNWMPKVMMLEGAYSADIWNAKPNGLCKNYCWVSSCAHCGRK